MSMPGGGRPGGPAISHIPDEELGSGPPILGRIAVMLKPYRTKMGFVAIAVVSAAVLTSIAPFLTRAVFDKALFPKSGGVDLHLLGWLVAGMCAIPVVTALIGIGQNWLTSTIGNSAMADLRSDLFAHIWP